MNTANIIEMMSDIHTTVDILSIIKRKSNENASLGEAIQSNFIREYGDLERIRFVDLLSDSDTPAIHEPPLSTGLSDRAFLSHKKLKDFVINFDLQQFGLQHGARVATLLPNGPELAVCLLSVISKWCAVPLNPTITVGELKSEIKSSKAQAIILLSGAPGSDIIISTAEQLNIGILVITPLGAIAGLFRMVMLSPVPSDRDDKMPNSTVSKRQNIKLLLHTSGTSGNKKLVPYTFNMVLIGVSCIIESWQLTHSDVCLNMMPLFHIGGIMRNVLAPILSGGTLIACSGFDALLFWDVLSLQRVTWYYAAPTMHHAILLQAEQRRSTNSDLSTSSIRFIANAAGGLLPVLALGLKATFKCLILTSYGMTECMPISTPPPEYNLDPSGTSGKAVGPSILIVDDDLKLLTENVKGNIFVRGVPCFSGYEDNDTANEESFFTINGQSGWFNTGDMGYLDANGYLFISGRSKEIINRGGETISPFEIEEALVQHKDIKEAIAFSAPHAQYQESVGALIVLKGGCNRPDLVSLHKYLDDKLHRSKWPQVLVFMDALPKNAAGKVLRIKFAERIGLNDIDEESSQLTRMYEGQCPPIGAPLTLKINVNLVKADDQILTNFLMNLPEVKNTIVIKTDFPFRQDAFIAFVVLADSEHHNPKEIEKLKLFMNHLQGSCEEKLHKYLVPAFIHPIHYFPKKQKSGGGEEIDYQALTTKALQIYSDINTVAPRNSIESQIEAIFRAQLSASSTVSVTASFFDLGGDSLKAGQLVSALRKKLRVQLSVSDLFTAPTIESLAHKISFMKTLGSPGMGSETTKKVNGSLQSSDATYNQKNKFESWEFSMHHSSTSFACLLTQSMPLLIIYPFRAIIIWFLIAAPWVELMRRGYGRFNSLICAMALARFLLGVLAPLVGIIAKWIIIGRYKVGKYPIWGSMYLRWWLVQQIIAIMGKGYFRDDLPYIGPHLVRAYYVMMGAKIGSNVKIHKDAKIGQPDLLTIGNDVVIDNATIRPFGLEEGHFVMLPITIGDRCSIGVKSVIAPGTVLPSGTSIGPLSSSHEMNDGEAHFRDYCRPSFSPPPFMLILLVGIPILLINISIGLVPWYLGLRILVSSAKYGGWYVGDIDSIHSAFMWWITPERLIFYFLIRIIRRCITPIIRLIFVIGVKKYFIGKFTPVNNYERNLPWNRFRYWLMTRLLPGGGLGGVAKLVGTHYEIISIIYRLLGAKVGKRVYWPGSGLEIVEYDLLEVGDDVVFGSRSVIMTSSAKRSAKVIFEAGTMIADRCVILPGVTIRKGAVLGSGSLAEENMDVPVGSIWVGSTGGRCVMASPADPSYNVKDTITPFGRAFYLGQATFPVIPLHVVVIYNMIWQAFCTCYRNCPIALSLMLCRRIMSFDDIEYSPRELFQFTMLAFIPINIIRAIISLGVDIIGKWSILGKRVQGVYPWDESSYCQLWQLYLTIQEIRRAERRKCGILDMIQGSQYLVWYFRALGSTIGKNVCLYPNGGDPMMTEPDLVTIGDNACIDDASLIAHINTRGIFRLNPLNVGSGCVLKSMCRLLSGASTEPHSILKEHTLVLAGENVDSGQVWQGWPSASSLPLTNHRAELIKMLEKELFDSSNRDKRQKQEIRMLKRAEMVGGVSFKEIEIQDPEKGVKKMENEPLLLRNQKSNYSSIKAF